MATTKAQRELSPAQCDLLLPILKNRFEKNMNRHNGLDWKTIQSRLEERPDKLWSLNEMEITGGEPDVVGARFCDRRYNHVFVYHNGAESYYGARGFRGALLV